MLLWLTLTALIATFALIYLKIYKPMQKWQKLGVPYVNTLPGISNIRAIISDQKSKADFICDIYNTHDARYIGFYNVTIPILMIKDLNLIKQIGIRDFDHFVDRRKIIAETHDRIWAKNLASLRGQKWRNMRATLSPAFTVSKMRAMFVLISECAEQFTNYFKNEIKPGESMIVELQDIFTRFSNDIFASCAYGITCDSMKEKNNKLYMIGKNEIDIGSIRLFRVFLNVTFPWLVRFFDIKIINDDVSNFFRKIIKNNVKSREEQGIIRPDMIHLLMEARKGKLKHDEHKIKNEDVGFAAAEESHIGRDMKARKNDLSIDDIASQALLFYIGGFDTVSITMCHMAYELALNEDIQRRLQEEIDETMEEHNGKLTHDTVIKMKYLDMVLSETLRKWPSIIFLDRECSDSYTIPSENPNEPDIHLKENDLVWFPVFALHRDPQYFPDPEKFDPERFSDENKVNINPLSYMPFGVGPRNCISSRFAILEVKMIFCQMMSKFKFEICQKSQVPLKINIGKFNVYPEKGFWVALKARN